MVLVLPWIRRRTAATARHSNSQVRGAQPGPTIRRTFVTDAIRSGLPPHIADKICIHSAMDTTMRYLNPQKLHQTGEKLQVAC